MTKARPAITAMIDRACAGEISSIARLITVAESGEDLWPAEYARLAAQSRNAYIVGVTGPPGVGKSTLVSGLVLEFRGRGKRVGVLAIDPMSSRSQGALLGDRVRMKTPDGDTDIFIRSMAGAGDMGGLAWAVPEALRVLDAAGYDPIFVETVGAGQSEIAVSSVADTTIVVDAPGLGDVIQANKAGILEVGDIFVVNKGDLRGADRTVRDLEARIHVSAGDLTAGWIPPVVKAVARSGAGLVDIARAIEAHRAWLISTGTIEQVHRKRAAYEVESYALMLMRQHLTMLCREPQIATLFARISAGEATPRAVSLELIRQVSENALGQMNAQTRAAPTTG